MTGVVLATDGSPLSRVLPEATLADVVDLFVRLVEGAAALVVFTGAVIAFVRISVAVVRRSDESAFVPIRFDLGRFLLVGLEFPAGGGCAQDPRVRQVEVRSAAAGPADWLARQWWALSVAGLSAAGAR